ncbi:hypothetical protein Hypma_014168 [Hypsizygus marmoreus]|uniref:DDE-1 domain-containing protein n=1 Tax=Hypsizygus marmoreus TaxID=39966 RepID=A0A369K8C1_HYPMA|nr:hypothetical protein Hypma_014168 [Hypsizygus marmoreus]
MPRGYQSRERQQRHRNHRREEKIKEVWMPGQKRKRIVDLEDHDDTGRQSEIPVAEKSRPRRQYKEDARKKKKLCGQKCQQDPESAVRINWFIPLLWDQIENAARRAGKPWSPRRIVYEAQKLNSDSFARLMEQVVGRWIDPIAKAAGVSKWKEMVMKQVANRSAPGGETTRAGILDAFPEVKNIINVQLTSLRKAGVPLTLLSIRGIMNMGWSERRATKAAQKLPENHEEVLHNAFLHEAAIIRDHAIPAALCVNTDQTQIVYQQGSQRTWNKKGVKQVATVGQEEKRAFTLVPSVSASGVLLPMQSVFHGKTHASCPGKKAACFNEALDLNYQQLPSKSATYWSTQETMRRLINEIIAPYFDGTKVELDLPLTQSALWKIDCWSVHKSNEFLTWMKTNHPNIIVSFVPSGCTSMWQPLDVGIQRILKLSIKRSAHCDIVEEVSEQLASEKKDIFIDTTLGNLHDRSVHWVVNAIHDINKKDIILKSFELCTIGKFNCSHASMISPEALAELRNLPKTNPKLHHEISSVESSNTPGPSDVEPVFSESADDPSDIPLKAVQEHVSSLGLSVPDGFASDNTGGLVRTGTGEDIMAEMEESQAAEVETKVYGRGHRKLNKPPRWGGEDAWETG